MATHNTISMEAEDVGTITTQNNEYRIALNEKINNILNLQIKNHLIAEKIRDEFSDKYIKIYGGQYINEAFGRDYFRKRHENPTMIYVKMYSFENNSALYEKFSSDGLDISELNNLPSLSVEMTKKDYHLLSIVVHNGFSCHYRHIPDIHHKFNNIEVESYNVSDIVTIERSDICVETHPCQHEISVGLKNGMIIGMGTLPARIIVHLQSLLGITDDHFDYLNKFNIIPVF